MNKVKLLYTVLAIVILFGGGIWWASSHQTENTQDSDIVTTKGLHWHPILTIMVNGVKQVIPENIGIGSQYASNNTFDRRMGMTPVHTHDDAVDGVVHFEFGGTVRKSDLTLKNFFEIWGKDINSFGVNLRMTVNGVENTEFENYSMKDGDQVVLNYE